MFDIDNLIFLIAILIFIFQSIANILKRREESKRQQPVPQEEEPYEVLPPQEEEPLPVPEESIPPLPEEWREKLPEVEVEEPIIYQAKAAEEIIPLESAVPYQIEEPIETRYAAGLTADKLREGIILSTILGPPKAYRFMGRGGGMAYTSVSKTDG